MVDEDYKRTYPFNNIASKVIGFTGADNQGIVGLEVKYDDYLKGEAGYILTTTNARGIEIDKRAEERIEPKAGKDLYTSIDINIQKFAMQAALNVMEAKDAKNVKILVMNPNNGEIYSMVNVPEFNLNEPYKLSGKNKTKNIKELNKKLMRCGETAVYAIHMSRVPCLRFLRLQPHMSRELSSLRILLIVPVIN